MEKEAKYETAPLKEKKKNNTCVFAVTLHCHYEALWLHIKTSSPFYLGYKPECPPALSNPRVILSVQVGINVQQIKLFIFYFSLCSNGESAD